MILGHTGRFAYAFAAGACTLTITAFAVLVEVVASLLALVASGFVVAAPDPVQFVCWIGEVWLSVAAYAVLAAAVALLSKSTVLVAVVGFLLGGAAVENLLYSAIGLITGHPNEVRAIFDGDSSGYGIRAWLWQCVVNKCIAACIGNYRCSNCCWYACCTPKESRVARTKDLFRLLLNRKEVR